MGFDTIEINLVIGKYGFKEQTPAYFQHNGKIISDYLDIAGGLMIFFASKGPMLIFRHIFLKVVQTHLDFQKYQKFTS